MRNKYSRQFESYYIKSIYDVTFELPRIFVLQNFFELFDYINSESIRKHQIKRMGVLKELTHPNVRTASNFKGQSKLNLRDNSVSTILSRKLSLPEYWILVKSRFDCSD